MTDFEALAKVLMRKIRRELHDSYYFRKELSLSDKTLDEVTTKLAEALEDEFELGRKAGEQATLNKLLKGLGGRK
ncbi:hypothetical protein [Ligilactobacillus apodemi]|uniref:hypothetical protein n=1 Tax=Ligilactobacillus apodemi TaxID=307126 RepID=UPI00214BED37|nr:hypothetical protein [Ligilactobacillus apodemi]MCR1901633.1 hypothetical protein [Ligilactobacillus apodemi]